MDADYLAYCEERWALEHVRGTMEYAALNEQEWYDDRDACWQMGIDPDTGERFQKGEADARE